MPNRINFGINNILIADISTAHIVVDDELCGPSSIENPAKNNPCYFDVRHFLHGCNNTKRPFRYIQ